MAMKRSAENLEMESIDMAKCLILFSHTLNQNKPTKIFQTKTYDIFECKTCNKRFSSFQALGGHRASHKKPRLMPSAAADEAKPKARKMHECSICGVEFALGQALGGHMRRHRDRAARAESFPSSATDHHQLVPKLPILRRSNSTNKRVFGLDLNLTPLENDLEYLFGKNLAPKVDPFLL